MLEELQRLNYTTDTIRGYILAVEQFARYFHKSPELMGAEEIAQFQLHLLREQKLAVGTIALRMGVFKRHRDFPASVAPPSPRRDQSAGSDHSARVPDAGGIAGERAGVKRPPW